jgi:hypothetical protein
MCFESKAEIHQALRSYHSFLPSLSLQISITVVPNLANLILVYKVAKTEASQTVYIEIELE